MLYYIILKLQASLDQNLCKRISIKHAFSAIRLVNLAVFGYLYS